MMAVVPACAAAYVGRHDGPRLHLEHQTRSGTARRRCCGCCARSSRTCSACQETKTPVEAFPLDGLGALGYGHVVVRGEKAYNGVAILSRLPVEAVGHRDFCTRGDARHVAARLPSGAVVHNLYVPAGGDLPDPALNPKFAHKLDFLAELRAWFAAIPPERAILVGDLNVAPREDDVWNHKRLSRIVSHTPAEVEALTAAQGAGGWAVGLEPADPRAPARRHLAA